MWLTFKCGLYLNAAFILGNKTIRCKSWCLLFLFLTILSEKLLKGIEGILATEKESKNWEICFIKVLTYPPTFFNHCVASHTYFTFSNWLKVAKQKRPNLSILFISDICELTKLHWNSYQSSHKDKEIKICSPHFCFISNKCMK